MTRRRRDVSDGDMVTTRFGDVLAVRRVVVSTLRSIVYFNT